MFTTGRMRRELNQWEEQLASDEKSLWDQTCGEIRRRSLSRVGWGLKWILSWVFQNHSGDPCLTDPASRKLLISEIEEEVRSIFSDYGVLFLEGIQGLFFISGVLFFQQSFTRMYVTPYWMSFAIVITLVFWPFFQYSRYRRRIHPLKKRQMVLLGILTLMLLGFLWFSEDNPLLKWLFSESLLPNPAMALYLILFWGIVVVNMIANYRRTNQLYDLRNNYPQVLIAFAPWPLRVRRRMLRELRYMGGKPVKARLRKLYKIGLIQGQIPLDGFTRHHFKQLHRKYCIEMHWQYWVCSSVQSFILLIFIGKGLWLLFDPMSILADYYSIPLTTGALLGAVVIGGGIIQGINYSVRLWVYGEDGRLSAVLVRVLTLMLAAPGVAVLSGLSPGGFLIGFVVNPISNLWIFWFFLILVIVLQYGKYEWWKPQPILGES